MIQAFLVNFVNLFVFAFNIVLLARVVMSWVSPIPKGRFGILLFELTEPVLLPLRKILPRSQFLDLSPLVAFLLLQVLAEVVNRTWGQ
jgi:YggT family protein